MAVKILTDTGCDLPKSILEDLNIECMPLLVYLDEKEYLDGETIDHPTFYSKMRDGASTRTAQIPAGTLEEKFLTYKDSKDEILYIAFSSGLSGTYQTAVMVLNALKEEHDLNITIIDSKSASIGFGLVVYYAALMAQEGLPLSDIIKKTEFHIEHMEHIFTVDDLEYLYRGGRVSRGAAVMGSMLSIKPILDVEDGKLIPLQKIRTRKKAIARILEIVGERGNDLDQQTVAINHGDDLETALKLKSMIEDMYGVKDFIINYTGCAIGAHSGPGTISVFFLNQLS
jgi:DegV family protein with EDD domain